LTKRQAPETRAQNDNVRIHLFHLGNNFKCAVDESKSVLLMKAGARPLQQYSFEAWGPTQIFVEAVHSGISRQELTRRSSFC
jgi:hypothetical protein